MVGFGFGVVLALVGLAWLPLVCLVWVCWLPLELVALWIVDLGVASFFFSLVGFCVGWALLCWPWFGNWFCLLVGW